MSGNPRHYGSRWKKEREREGGGGRSFEMPETVVGDDQSKLATAAGPGTGEGKKRRSLGG